MKRALALVALIALAGCELEETALAPSADIVVAEVVLRAPLGNAQMAWLHRTVGGRRDGDPRVRGARIVITGDSGRIELHEVNSRECLSGVAATPRDTLGTCYASPGDGADMPILPQHRYSLDIRLADGGHLTGVTTVPGELDVLRPSVNPCSLAPLSNFELTWSVAPDTWVYATETYLVGIRPALEAQGIKIETDPLRLVGLSVSRADTTLVFPRELGLFERGEEELTVALVALQKGLPPGVVANINLGAGDRNYVNWERGGGFNPSGAVRVPSIHGDGTGVFGSVFLRSFQIRSGDSRFPAC